MSAQPVDVLDTGVVLALRALADQFEQNGQGACAREQNRIAAAVAELIEAARDYADATGTHTDERWAALRAFYGDAPIPVARARLRAALARIGAP